MRKENVLPHQWRGRWYRAFLETDGNAYTLTKTDLTGTDLNGNYLEAPENFHVVDIKYDVHSVSGGTSNTVGGLRIFTNGNQGVPLPGKDSFDYCTIYIFGYFD